MTGFLKSIFISYLFFFTKEKNIGLIELIDLIGPISRNRHFQLIAERRAFKPLNLTTVNEQRALKESVLNFVAIWVRMTLSAK